MVRDLAAGLTAGAATADAQTLIERLPAVSAELKASDNARP
jgi:hypothetical protein